VSATTIGGGLWRSFWEGPADLSSRLTCFQAPDTLSGGHRSCERILASTSEAVGTLISSSSTVCCSASVR
jgi:hypothetical protein